MWLALLVACLADPKETPVPALAIAALLVVVGIVFLFVREVSRLASPGLPIILNAN